MSQYQPGPQPHPGPPPPPSKKGLSTGGIIAIAIVVGVVFLCLIGGCAAILGVVASTSAPDVNAVPSTATAEVTEPAASTSASATAPKPTPTKASASAPAAVGILVTCQSLFGKGDKRGPLFGLIDFITDSAKTPATDLDMIKAAKANNDAVVRIGTTAKEPLKSGIALMTKDTGPWLERALDGGSQTLSTDNFVVGGNQVTKACGADDEPAPEPEPEPAPEPVNPYDKLSRAEQNAVDSARSYLDGQAFSRDGLYDQLTSEYGSDFSKKLATLAINFVEKQDEVSWNKEAEEAAESYLDSQSFSCNGLIGQLSSEYGSQFTQKQARHGARSTGIC